MPDNMTSPPPPNPVSSNFFTSKPFIVLVLSGIVLCGGIMFFQSLSEKTVLSFSFTLDGKNLPADKVPDVKVDGQPFMSGNKIKIGRHALTVQLQDAEPIEKHYWVLFGAKNLGALPIESSKGSLVVSVTPSPATVVVQRNGETVSQGAAPLTLDKLPVGNYSLLIKRGEYEENRAVIIQRQQQTKVQGDLNLGSADLSSDPADAEYELTGNGRHWQGKLPTKTDDLPGGNYSLVVRRKGWELSKDISISRGSVTTNKTEFQYGSIEVTSDPTGLAVSTNGVEIGKTPMTLQDLKPGQYTLSASDGENDLMADVSVGPKEATKHAFVFHYGAVQLSSTPTGATVIRKGKEVGKTPLTLNHIPAGETIVELRLQDYVSTNCPIQTVEGVTNQLSAKLISENYLRAMKQARDAFGAGQLAQSQNYLALALSIQPDDSSAMQLRDEVSTAAAKAEEARKEAELKAEIARKEAEHVEIIGVIEKAINAEGGREVLNQMRSFKVVSRSTGKKDGADFAMRTTIYVQLPDNIRVDQETANLPKNLGPLTLTVNGGKPNNSIFCVTRNVSWEVVPTLLGSVRQDVPQNIQNLFRGSLYNMECASLIPLLGPDYTLKKVSMAASAPDNTVAIKVHKDGKTDLTLYFDKNSGLLAGIDSIGSDEHGRTFQQSERYSEYRRFSSLVSPTITKYVREGNTSGVSFLESLEPLNQYYGNVFSPPNNSK